MSAKWIACLAVGSFLLGAATTYYARPAKVVTKTEVREKIITVTEKEKHDDVVTVHQEVDRPDGTKVIRDVTVDKSVFKEEQKTDETLSRSETKTVEQGGAQWNLRAMAALSLRAAPPVYGGGIERRILGPIYLGAFGFSNGTAGVSIALSF